MKVVGTISLLTGWFGAGAVFVWAIDADNLILQAVGMALFPITTIAHNWLLDDS